MTDETGENSKGPTKSRAQLSAEAAKDRAANERRRSLEVSASFYDKLSALGAGSIAVTVSVGIALLGKLDSHIGSVHSHLTWLLWIAALLWLSLICSIGHNSLFVRIARLEATQSKDWSIYLESLAALSGSSGEIADILSKHILSKLKERINDRSMREHHIQQSVLRALYLGRIAVGTFLSAYTLVLICLIRLWCVTR